MQRLERSLPSRSAQCGLSDSPEKTIVAVTNDTAHVFICALLPAMRAMTFCTIFRCSTDSWAPSAMADCYHLTGRISSGCLDSAFFCDGSGPRSAAPKNENQISPIGLHRSLALRSFNARTARRTLLKASDIKTVASISGTNSKILKAHRFQTYGLLQSTWRDERRHDHESVYRHSSKFSG